MHNSWQQALAPVLQSTNFLTLQQKVAEAREQGPVYPPADEVFAALELTPLDKVKVVILGQDPYHGPGQAHGLAFSVNKGIKVPPSLRNIYKLLEASVNGFTTPEHGDLRPWAHQGVLMLNTVLTVPKGNAHGHAKWGWEQVTDAIIGAVNQHRANVVFLLWGKPAEKKAALIDGQRQHILTSAHPSPLSARRGFFDCDHFNQANQLLAQSGQSPIDWRLAPGADQGDLFS